MAGVASLPSSLNRGAVEDDVVGLPLARRARGVDQRRVLAVDRAAPAVGVGRVLIAVEDLDLVAAEEEDAAVAAALAVAFDVLGRGELEVELEVAELVLACG